MATNGGNGSLKERQEARRKRLIQAALALGAEGGYDAVQMREVSEEVHAGIVDLIGHVWYSTLARWANGLMPLDEVAPELERMVRLVVEPYDVTLQR
jgi:hypothetical protein